MTPDEPRVYLALTRAEVEYLTDQTPAQKPHTRDLAVRLAGCLVELAAVDDVRIAQGLVTPRVVAPEAA